MQDSSLNITDINGVYRWNGIPPPRTGRYFCPGWGYGASHNVQSCGRAQKCIGCGGKHYQAERPACCCVCCGACCCVWCRAFGRRDSVAVETSAQVLLPLFRWRCRILLALFYSIHCALRRRRWHCCVLRSCSMGSLAARGLCFANGLADEFRLPLFRSCCSPTGPRSRSSSASSRCGRHPRRSGGSRTIAVRCWLAPSRPNLKLLSSRRLRRPALPRP